MNHELKKPGFGTLRNPSENQSKLRKTNLYVGMLRMVFWICFSCFFVATEEIGFYREIQCGNRFLSGNSMWKSVFYREIQCGNRFFSGNSIWKSASL